jgi:hypothetical protein
LYTGAPIVLNVEPYNGATDVSYLHGTIKVWFSSNMAFDEGSHPDLNRVTNPNYVYVIKKTSDGSMSKVAGSLTYNALDRCVMFKADSGLEPNTEYQVYVLGSNNSLGGVQDVREAELETTFVSMFTTAALIVGTPSLLAPVTHSTVNQVPELKWSVVEFNNATYTRYQVNISKHIDFSSILLDVTDDFMPDEDGYIEYTPSVTLEDRTIYFWRVRSTDGPWSETSQFYYTIRAEYNGDDEEWPVGLPSIVASIPSNGTYNATATTFKIKLSDAVDLEDVEESIKVYMGQVSEYDVENADLVPLTEVTGTITAVSDKVFEFIPDSPLVTGYAYTLHTNTNIEEAFISFTKDTDVLYADPSTVLGSLDEILSVDTDYLIGLIRGISQEAQSIMEEIISERNDVTIQIDWAAPPSYIANYVKYRVQEAILTEKYIAMSTQSQSKVLADLEVSYSYSPADLLALLDAVRGQIKIYLDAMYALGMKRTGIRVVSPKSNPGDMGGYPEHSNRSIPTL